MKKDLALIAGNFLDFPIEKNKRYLLKYFTSKIQQQFVRYRLVFEESKNFVNHTGLFCQKRWLQTMESRFLALESALHCARMVGDMDRIAKIESGKFNVK